jgi:hypothetical protein
MVGFFMDGAPRRIDMGTGQKVLNYMPDQEGDNYPIYITGL